MIFGIGTDLLEIERMRKGLQRFDQRLAARILHPDEWPRFEREGDRARWLSKCFAAKEALVKALGTGFQGIAARDIGLVAAPSGQPKLVFSAHGDAVLSRLGVHNWHISMTDQSELVMAFVVLESASSQPLQWASGSV